MSEFIALKYAHNKTLRNFAFMLYLSQLPFIDLCRVLQITGDLSSDFYRKIKVATEITTLKVKIKSYQKRTSYYYNYSGYQLSQGANSRPTDFWWHNTANIYKQLKNTYFTY